MSPNKRKTFHIDCEEESSTKYRRSSLAVNLSYTNLTDSGHGSFKKTQNRSNELSTNQIQSYNDEQDEMQHFDKSSSRRCTINKVNNISCKEDKLLRNVNVRIVDIRHIRKTDTDYEKLRNAILNKTKEIFNKQDECAIKTNLVLENQNDSANNRNQPNEVTSNNGISITSEKNIHSDKLSIFSTPVNKSCNVKRYINSSKVTKRKLFKHTDIIDHHNVETVGEIDHNVKNNLPQSPIISRNYESSPIITGSDKKHRTSKLSLKNTSKIATRPNVQEDQISLSSLNSVTDGHGSIGTPLFCSTFNEGSNRENKTSNGENNINNQKSENINANIVSMELTSLQELRTMQYENICIEEINAADTINYSEIKNKEKSKIQEVQTNFPTKIFQSSHHNVDKNRDISTSNNSKKNLEDHELSLNVNTSVDNEMEDRNNSKESVNKNIEQESIATVRSSLQVNTSLNSTYKHRQSYNTREQTRQQNTKKPEQHSLHNGKSVNENNGSISYIECTPYHAPQTVQSKSQLKHDTVISNAESNHTKTIEISNTNNVQEEDKSISSLRNKSCLHKVSTTHALICNGKGKNVLHNSVILGDSPILTLNKQQYKKVIINDSLSETELNKDKINDSLNQGNAHSKPNKKKLLPLWENPVLSFSPKETLPNLSPKQPLLTKKRKKFKKKAKSKKFLQQPLETQAYHTTSGLKKHDSDSSENDFVINKKQKKDCKKLRKVVSKKIVIKKFADSDILKQLENLHTYSDQETELLTHKNSLNEFQTRKEIAQELLHKSQKIIIVVTGFSKGDKNLIKNIVKSLGMARIEPNVTRRTTHVVSTGVRTLNLLHGIIRGCWLVKLEWVLKSLENNGWLNPEQYEMAHFSKAVQENRKDRELFGMAYVPELFATCGFLYIENGTTPPSHTLKELVKTAGGRITEDPKAAKIIIGANGIKESWILDCITTGDLQPVTQYKKKVV
ncbi:hypothetical protein KPH14_004399 [Odynerus spinipes]|uniref:BRCT domain-containing protein n=1 Tax=Odynerus spinipes TaxID=1348599 RepID=A0AAD9VVC8_9HYME|nr:hypothetical protein KPH14_004399 [Odynerus spinipes]